MSAELWKFESQSYSWQLVSNRGPSARGFHVAVWDPLLAAVWVHGGFDGQAARRDLWRFETSKRLWHLVDVEGPPARFFHVATWHVGRRCLYLHGGRTPDLQVLQDFWEYQPELTVTTTSPTVTTSTSTESTSLSSTSLSSTLSSTTTSWTTWTTVTVSSKTWTSTASTVMVLPQQLGASESSSSAALDLVYVAIILGILCLAGLVALIWWVRRRTAILPKDPEPISAPQCPPLPITITIAQSAPETRVEPRVKRLSEILTTVPLPREQHLETYEPPWPYVGSRAIEPLYGPGRLAYWSPVRPMHHLQGLI